MDGESLLEKGGLLNFRLSRGGEGLLERGGGAY